LARVGILGGTFNPPHLGHLVCASEAAAQLELDRVLLIPAATPPHKRTPEDPGAEVRLELCRLAVAGDERLEVCDIELRRGGVSYTVDTLRELHEHAPEDDLTFIVGGDIALGLPAWHDPEGVLELATLAVAERSGAGRHDVAERLGEALPGRTRLQFFEMPRLDISSSQIRRRAADGRPIRYLVPDSVAEHIARERLYT